MVPRQRSRSSRSQQRRTTTGLRRRQTRYTWGALAIAVPTAIKTGLGRLPWKFQLPKDGSGRLSVPGPVLSSGAWSAARVPEMPALTALDGSPPASASPSLPSPAPRSNPLAPPHSGSAARASWPLSAARPGIFSSFTHAPCWLCVQCAPENECTGH